VSSSLFFVVFLDIETHMMQSLKKCFFVAAVLLFIFKSQSFLLLCHCDHQHCCWRSSSFEKETGCFFHTAQKIARVCVCVCVKKLGDLAIELGLNQSKFSLKSFSNLAIFPEVPEGDF